MGIVIDGELPEEEPETFYLWPECVEVWSCWQGVQTQWRIGLSGAAGLDYQGVSAYLDLQGIELGKRRELFELLQACERVTLDEWAKQRAKNQPR